MIDLLDLVTLWPPFVSSEVDAGPSAATFLAALKTRLLSLPEPGDVTDVFLSKAGMRAEFPYILIHSIDSPAFVNNTNSRYENVLMQYEVKTLDPDDTQLLGEAVRDAMVVGPPLVFANGYEMARWLERTRDAFLDSGPGPGGADVWIYRFDFTHQIGKG